MRTCLVLLLLPLPLPLLAACSGLPEVGILHGEELLAAAATSGLFDQEEITYLRAALCSEPAERLETRHALCSIQVGPLRLSLL